MKKFLIAIVVLAIVVGGIWFFSKKAEAPIDQVTAGWKTYHNDQYGFEFKYPPENFEVAVEGNNNSLLSVSAYPTPQPIEFGPHLSVTVIKNGDSKVLQDYLKTLQSDLGSLYLGQETVEREGITWYRVRENDDYFGFETNVNLYTSQNGKIYSFSYFPVKDPQTAVFDQILSTFTFSLPTKAVVAATKNFEEALNANNWTEVRKYLTDNVTVNLEGTECCGLQSADAAVENLKRVAGIKFTFDQSSQIVKGYLSDPVWELSSNRLLAPNIHSNDLTFGVENNPFQTHKAAIGYFPKTGKVTYLLINPGRDNGSLIDTISLFKKVLYTLPVGVMTPDPSTGLFTGQTNIFTLNNDTTLVNHDVAYYFNTPPASDVKSDYGLVVINANYGASMTDVYPVLVGNINSQPKQITYANLWNHPNLKDNKPYSIGVTKVKFLSNDIVEVTASLRYGNNFTGYNQVTTFDYQIKNNQLLPIAG